MFVFGSLYLSVSTCLCAVTFFHYLIHHIDLNQQIRCLQVFHIGIW